MQDIQLVKQQLEKSADRFKADITALTVTSRQTSLAITNAEQALLWALRSIDENGASTTPPEEAP